MRLQRDGSCRDRRERTERAREGRDRVVRAEEPGRVVPLGRVRKHRLLERGERPRFHDLRRKRSGQGGDNHEPDRAGQREDRSRSAHHDEQAEVPPPASSTVAVTGEHDRDERRAGDECSENEPHLDAREAEVCERHPDEDTAEPVCERAARLDEQDPAGVRPESHAVPSRSGARRRGRPRSCTRHTERRTREATTRAVGGRRDRAGGIPLRPRGGRATAVSRRGRR